MTFATLTWVNDPMYTFYAAASYKMVDLSMLTLANITLARIELLPAETGKKVSYKTGRNFTALHSEPTVYKICQL